MNASFDEYSLLRYRQVLPAYEYIFLVFFFFQEQAFDASQKYKEGKYIIELAHMIKENGWDSPPS